MRCDLTTLASETFDLLIIGGGVNGLATAWDASLRGLKVALVEKGDFGAATSAASLKIIHGGLRYLQHADFPRMREGIQERRALLRIAPHLIEPFPFLVPTSGLATSSRMAMRVAMAINDAVSWDRNKGQPHESRHIPRGRSISARECLEIAPGLNPQGVTGGAIFCDGRMHNAERMNLLFGIAADRLGAQLANYVAVTGFEREGGLIRAATCRDEESSETFSVRAKLFLNMTGPWTDHLLHLASPDAPAPAMKHSAGFQIMSPMVTTREIGLAVTSHYEDPDALVKRGGRHYFTTPWRRQTIWGTTDSLYQGDPDSWAIPETEIEEFITDINHAMPGAKLSRDQVTYAYGGLRPVDEQNLHSGSRVSRKHAIYDHRSDLGIENLISVRGVKYTACRLLAERATDQALAYLQQSAKDCATATTCLPGGDYPDWASLEARLPAALPADIVYHLCRTYGGEVDAIAKHMAEDAGQERLGADCPVTVAEVMAALDDPSLLHLDDLLFRRTQLCTAGTPAPAVMDRVLALATEARAWDAERAASEQERVARRLLPSG